MRFCVVMEGMESAVGALPAFPLRAWLGSKASSNYETLHSLHKCASQDNVDGIMYFIQNKRVDVNKLDDFGQSALCLAAHHGSSNAISELCYFNADVDLASKQKGWTPIHYAANAGHASVVKQLYEEGANCTLADKAGYTAAHLAAQCNQVEVRSRTKE